MDNRNLSEAKNDELWVAERLRALDPETEWTPNPGGALARLHRKQHLRTNVRRLWLCGTAAAAIAVVALVALPSPAACAIAGVACPHPTATVLPASAVALEKKPASKSPSAGYPSANYKESGSTSAPIICEIYSDYECPACGEFYRDVFPQLEARYVKAGKVRIVHRDFPLPMHPYALRAARYADAAGELGYYDVVFRRLFALQPQWSATGDLDSIVSAVVPREKMAKLRDLVDKDPTIDETLAADMENIRREQINQTPTLILISNGTRQKLAGSPPFDVLARYLDQLLKH